MKTLIAVAVVAALAYFAGRATAQGSPIFAMIDATVCASAAPTAAKEGAPDGCAPRKLTLTLNADGSVGTWAYPK